jgi:hypothetical protein
VHGTALPGTDDRDQMGVCIEPPEYVLGLRRFEQYERHTAWDRGGLTERSGAGDLDVTVYSARKFCRLALDGNPSILTLLFVPEESIVEATPLGRKLMEAAPAFVSLQACKRYLGYLQAQRRGMTGQGRVNRPELIANGDLTSKFAGHAVRLGVQGLELMRNGRISLADATPTGGTTSRRSAEGEIPLLTCRRPSTTCSRSSRRSLTTIRTRHPEQPDRDGVNRMLIRMYRAAWAPRAFLDEHPDAYKAIETLIEDAADLVEIRHTLRQIVNVKGD